MRDWIRILDLKVGRRGHYHSCKKKRYLFILYINLNLNVLNNSGKKIIRGKKFPYTLTSRTVTVNLLTFFYEMFELLTELNLSIQFIHSYSSSRLHSSSL